jgi:hypothetical protein
LTSAIGGNICLATYLAAVHSTAARVPGGISMAAKKTKTKRAKKPAAKKAGKVAKKRAPKKGGRKKAGKRKKKATKAVSAAG